MTIDLERNPLPAGEATWATVSVRNRGRDAVTWFHDGCAIPVWVGGEVIGARWRQGIEQTGQAGHFKERLVDHEIGRVVRIDFRPEHFVGQQGKIGCADVGIADTIAPGDSITQRARWDGMADHALGLPPSGAVDLTGWADFFFRDPQPADIMAQRIELEGRAWIVDGKDPSWLDPPEVIDAALTDAAFVEWLQDKRLGYGMEEFIRFDQEAHLWNVGVVIYGRDILHYVRVDPASGAVVDTVERPFVWQVDGNM